MSRPRPLGLLLFPVIAGVLAAACGSPGGTASPTATAELTPLPEPSPTATPVGGRDVEAVEPETFIDLSADPPLLTIQGAGEDDLRTGGASLASGDFNNDGAQDLLVGAPFADGPGGSREDAGAAYVIFGPRPLSGEIDLAVDADLVILGAQAGDNLGFSVIGGDLNGDGIDDVVVGAPASNALTFVRTDMGEAYVVFGSPTLGGTVDLAKIDQDFTFRPAEGFTRVGTSLDIGDVNDDGIDDLIMGGPFGGREEGTPPGAPRTTVGEVYVIFGAPDLGGDWDLAKREVDVRLKGSQELDNFGQAVASADVNGDGVDDIIVTAKQADGLDDSRTEAGGAYVFFGSPDLSGLVGAAAADVVIYGADESDVLGDVAVTGDLDGDGLSDIVLSSRASESFRNLRPTAGEAYVIHGAPDLGGVIDLAEGSYDAVIYARDAADSAPSALAIVDGDGADGNDLIFGAAFADGPEDSRPEGGELYLLPSGGLTGEIDLRRDVEGRTFVYGAAADEQLGVALTALDFDGDGSLELLVLASGRLDTPGGRSRLYAIALPGR